MTLITDGGSTKCDWILLNAQGEVILQTQTLGLNPAVVAREELIQRITSNSELKSLFQTVDNLDFYGAGCGTKTPVKILHEVLSKLFVSAKVSVNEDTIAAVYAATTQPGIVCILGTGSNSCYFDGTTIHESAESLGYSIMDEASGNYFGKRLVRDYFYNKMPVELASQFKSEFNLEADEIKINLYKRPNPNMFLASFAKFMFTTNDVNNYFYNLLKMGIEEFIEYRVLCFKEAKTVPVHFIGSIAHFSEEVLKECIASEQLELGKIIRRPIDLSLIHI
ncbi:MAG: N-acetylglucosamine kinase, partial [Flavobacteriaceae bacterium]|nr:N-acetylglucosamine kinase [Flavobacteriaceae bacterium]